MSTKHTMLKFVFLRNCRYAGAKGEVSDEWMKEINQSVKNVMFSANYLIPGNNVTQITKRIFTWNKSKSLCSRKEKQRKKQLMSCKFLHYIHERMLIYLLPPSLSLWISIRISLSMNVWSAFGVWRVYRTSFHTMAPWSMKLWTNCAGFYE